MVYLHPTQIMAAVRRILPIDKEALQIQLEQAESELSIMEKHYRSIQNKARLRSQLANYTFFAALAAQWGILFRLTYWELSWDVTEPIGFFVGGLASMGSLAWFLKTRQDFSFEAMHQRFISDYERREFERSKFDIRKYKALKAEVERLRDVLDAHLHKNNELLPL